MSAPLVVLNVSDFDHFAPDTLVLGEPHRGWRASCDLAAALRDAHTSLRVARPECRSIGGRRALWPSASPAALQRWRTRSMQLGLLCSTIASTAHLWRGGDDD